jgi:hypothetical protein
MFKRHGDVSPINILNTNKEMAIEGICSKCGKKINVIIKLLLKPTVLTVGYRRIRDLIK